jgi:hypothetical protein
LQIDDLDRSHDLLRHLLRNAVVANDICHVYFVNDAAMHALHNLLASMTEEQASRRRLVAAS